MESKNESIMRGEHIRLVFAFLAGAVFVMVLVMQMRIGNVPSHMLREVIANSRRNVENTLRMNMAHSDHINGEADDDDALDTEHHHNNHEAHLHQERHDTHSHGKHHEHHDDGLHEPVWQPKLIPPTEHTVAVGLALTTRGKDLKFENIANEMPFFKSLLVSFCQTATTGYSYHFYVAHDHTDVFFSDSKAHALFEDTFDSVVKRWCSSTLNVTLHMVECSHAGHPAWAQNDAMMTAYMDNIAYYYRVNDDTIMETTGWTEKLIDQLQRYNPPNVGVAGPWCKDGNTAILTHDFVHRTHVDIYGFYYPRIFTDWFADDWITGVYWPERSRKVPGTRVKHTMEMGSRYVVHFEKARHVHIEVNIGKVILQRWLDRQEHVEHGNYSRDTRNIISMSLAGNDVDSIYGAIRYAQLIPFMLPKWRLRVYVSNSLPENPRGRVLDIVIKKLIAMEVEVVTVDDNTAREFPSPLWRFLAADDMSIDRFIIRDSNMRPSERESEALNDWLNLESPRAIYCIRDHPKHANKTLIPSLFGGVPKLINAALQQPWKALMKGYKNGLKFLRLEIWPKLKENCFCHDSISCTKWPNAHAFPILRKDNEFIGQHYDANDQLLDVDNTLLWGREYIQPDCVFVRNTGFSEETVRAVIRHRPVLWSQDYHITPVMDMKSLLGNVGVKIIDNSLSYYCDHVGTCGTNLKILNRENAMRPTSDLIDQFYEYYKHDDVMKSVTAFVCTLPVAMCEVFVKFNKSMIVIANIRYEQARPEAAKWYRLNNLLQNIYDDPKGLVAANNLYDAQYIQYFTGLHPIVIPNYCEYLKDTSYKPSRRQFLITPIHSSELYDKFFTEFDAIVIRRRVDLTLFPLRELYPQYQFSDLVAHPAIVYVPYQVSMASLTEQYRMNIPLFFPSINLLTKWHVEYQVVRQRTWAGYMMKRLSASPIGGVEDSWPDPNNDIDEDAIRYWLKFADFYQWPHIIYFDSVDDLVNKMLTVNLNNVSSSMKNYNAVVRQDIKNTWSKVLLKITEGKPIV